MHLVPRFSKVVRRAFHVLTYLSPHSTTPRDVLREDVGKNIGVIRTLCLASVTLLLLDGVFRTVFLLSPHFKHCCTF